MNIVDELKKQIIHSPNCDGYIVVKIDTLNQVLNELENKDKQIEHWKNGFERELEANRENICELLEQDDLLKKKDKVIDEIEDLCIRKSDEEGQEYGGVIIWSFANKIMDIIKKHKNSAK